MMYSANKPILLVMLLQQTDMKFQNYECLSKEIHYAKKPSLTIMALAIIALRSLLFRLQRTYLDS